MPLYSFVVQDGDGKGRVVGFSLVANEGNVTDDYQSVDVIGVGGMRVSGWVAYLRHTRRARRGDKRHMFSPLPGYCGSSETARYRLPVCRTAERPARYLGRSYPARRLKRTLRERKSGIQQ